MAPGKEPKKKTITGWAIVDWKQGKIRSRQTEPDVGDLGQNELPAKLKFDVSIPKVDVPTLAAEIDVPEPMVYSATLEALDDRDLPDYAKVADRVIADRVDDIQQAEADQLDDLLAGVTVKVLREVRGRPRIELVEEYVHEVIGEIRSD